MFHEFWFMFAIIQAVAKLSEPKTSFKISKINFSKWMENQFMGDNLSGLKWIFGFKVQARLIFEQHDRLATSNPLKTIDSHHQYNKTMITSKAIVLLLLVLLASAKQIPPTIISVSSSPSSLSNPVFSSLRGGRSLYIKAVGHNPNPSQNIILVGSIPCIIPSDGVTDTFISCVTGDSGSTTDIKNLPVTLIAYNSIFSTSYPNTVYYLASYTPVLNGVFPTAGYGGQNVNLWGVHGISNIGDGLRVLGDITKLKLGNDLCDRFDVVQPPISGYYNENLLCIKSKQQQAGKYNISEQVVIGFSDRSKYLRRPSFDPKEYYEFAALPTVTAVSPTNGNIGGQYLTISGNGFSPTLQNNTVTVDGNNCLVTSSTNDQIKCTLNARNTSLSTKLTTNSSSQQNGYFSGAGLQYARYTVNKAIDTIAQFVTAVRSSNASALGTPQEVGLRADMRQGDVYGANYAQTWKGYFTAPVSGVYTFRGTADDFFAVYFAQNYGSTELPSTSIINSSSYQTYNNFYLVDTPTAEATVTLTAGKSYYLEAYHINGASTGFFDLAVEVPNQDKSLLYQSHEVDKIYLSSRVQPEVANYSMIGGSSGIIQLEVTRINPADFTVTYTKKANVTYGATDAEFQAALNKFDGFSSYMITVVREIYNSNNTLITTLTNATRIDYLCSFYKLRPSNLSNEKFKVTSYGYTGQFTEAIIKQHSQLINGTFSLRIAGVDILIGNSTNIPYNVLPSTLQTAIRGSGIVGFDSVQVSRYSALTCEYACSWTIEYKGFNQPIPSITVNGISLTGGTDPPTIQAITKRQYSSNLIFDPVDYRFLNTYSSGINVQVSTNGVPALCNGTCGYTFYTYSEISALSLSGSTISMTITNPIPSSISISDIVVKVGSQICAVNSSSSLNALTCTLPTTNGVPNLVAGPLVPLVTIKNYGIVGLQSGVNPIDVSLNVIALSVTQAGSNGGILISVNGSGFPSDKSQISISICNKQATIKSVTNTEADFYLPSCANPPNISTVTITVNSKSDSSLTFTYLSAAIGAPIINSLNPSSANPGVKGTLQIIGQNFGTDKTQVKVFLANSTGKVYELTVLSITNSLIKVGVPGGLPGAFSVEVNVAATGDSIAQPSSANIFNYEFAITGIQPATGSYYGGTLLSITGKNFSPEPQQTLVYVGDTLNWFCNIEKINKTNILCRTPAISSTYLPGNAVQVTASTRLVILSECAGNCGFTYLAAAVSPTLNNISASSITVGNITLTGTSLLDSNNFAQIILTNKATAQTVILPTLSSDNASITFQTTSSIVSGNYIVKVRNSLGESNGLDLAIRWSVGTVSWNSGGSTAGAIVSLTGGSGYPSSIDGLIFSVSIAAGTVSYPVKIVSCCDSNSLSFQMPSALNGTFFTITLTGPLGSTKTSYTAYTSYTPTANLTAVTSNSNVTVGSMTISFAMTNNVSATIKGIKLVSTLDASHSISVATWNKTGTTYSFTAVLNAGSYRLMVDTAPYGYIAVNTTVNNAFPTNSITQPKNISFNGGTYTINASYLSPVSYITVNGFIGKIVTYSTSAVTYSVPALVSPSTQTAYKLVQPALLPISQFTLFSDQNASTTTVSSSFDEDIKTFYSSPNIDCWIGLDAGDGMQVQVTRLSLFPNLAWTNVAQFALYSVFQGSNDMTNWFTLATVDQTVHTGWNVLASNDSTAYRYIRYLHNATSKCSLAELKIYGVIYSTASVNLVSQPAEVIYRDGYNVQKFTDLTYKGSYTPVVTSVDPRYGDVAGGYTLTLTGTNLDSEPATIVIDGVICASPVATATTITCTVGKRNSTPQVANTFTVTLGSSRAILQDTFLYVLKWSNPTTWGVDTPPADDDLVYVPLGTTLLVDTDTPVLKGIAVEGGTLAFSDDKDITVQAGFITMNGGSFIAGTQQHPHTKKLTFIMHGDYYGTQMPMFGNKGIGCLNCKFSMFGQKRDKTWTTIAQTITAGATYLVLTEEVDWRVGEEIVVASTSFVHTEAERRRITAITNKKNITVDSAFNYKHVSLVQSYDGKYLAMQAEVGLLTRNIKMMGNSDSLAKKYGSHLMLSGHMDQGFQAHVAYSEFTHCGQPQILGRYCIHFHMAGDIPNSFARGNAVHDSFARVITIHGVHYLTVQDNVGYRVSGHNFFVEDGIETHNIIRNNLAISSLAVTNMLQTDTSVASFWVTNPTNDFYGNHAAGGDFYGIWYQIKANPDGPSATMDVCPTGNPLGKVTNNVAHSNIRFGLRIFQLAPRLYPCQPVRNNSNAADPWAQNPSVRSVFSNFTVYKNLQDGVLAEQTGNVIFDKFVIAQNYRSGIEFYMANFTKEPPTISDSAIIGMSNNNAHSDTTNYTNKMSAAITGRTGVFKLTNIHFYNYPAGSILLQTSRFGDDPLKYTNVGTEVLLDQLKFTNINGNWLYMIHTLKRDVIYDLDASFSQPFDGLNRSSATIVHGFPHIAAYNQNSCPFATTPGAWDNAVMCDSNITIRRVLFGNILNKQLFTSQPQLVGEVPDFTSTIDPKASPSLYSNVTSQGFLAMQPKVETPYTWSLPYITGRIYNVWWGSGIDFTHLSIYTTPSYLDTDLGIVFKFNYSENRELFRIGPMRGGPYKLTALDYIKAKETSAQLDINTCRNGDYFHNNTGGPDQLLAVCISGKNRTKFEYTEINGVVCEMNCPAPAGTFIKENFIRKWSNATQWGGTVPQPGTNVTVNGNWTVILDVDPNPLNSLIIDGTLIADDSRDVNITANFIHIRAGNLTAGSSSTPFLHKLTIQLNGQKSTPNFVVGKLLTANKLLAVTGSLNLYANPPNSVNTFLKQTAKKGSNIISVGSSDGWAAGDTIVLSPSFGNPSQFESATIQSINPDGTIILASSLSYTHYGASSLTINNEYGKLDTRTKVGHVSRNIMIVPGPEAGWGFTVTVHGYLDDTIKRIGSVQLSGVQFLDGGQLDSLNSPLVFSNSLGNTIASSVTDCSFLNCKANCIYVKNSQNITFTNNVLYNAWVFGAQLSQIKSVTFSSNVIIGVYQKPTLPEGSQLVACLYVVEYINPLTDLVSVKDNFCLGSSQDGFAFPHIKCTQLENNPLANNTVGSAQIGFILNTNGQRCQAFSYAKAFACKIGQICGSMGVSTLIFNQFLMADNGRSVTLKFGDGQGHTNHTAFLYNSYISAVSRPSCSDCYGSSATDCSGVHGLRMLVPSANGEQTPKKFNSGFDVVCKQPVYDSKSFLVNVTFDNFRQNYTNTSVAQICRNNFALRPHGSAWDQSGSANLFTSKCNNCDSSSFLFANPPNPDFLGWFGGCGDIMCTGFQNYLVQDFDGSFLGSKATIIPNNSVIAANEADCTFVQSMNSHFCKRLDFSVLEYQNVAADFNTRIMWPVSLTYDGSNYTTITNGWREWEWLGNEPQNKRFGRFVSIVRLNQTYNMTFNSQAPSELQVQLQKRQPLGESEQYVIVRIYYPLPNSIRVNYKGKIVDPILLTNYNSTAIGTQRTLNTSECGSNIYFYTNRTIAFVVTSAQDCLITVEVTQSVQLTTHFSADISTFFSSNTTITNFINNLCALLNIMDTSRVKIVGVYNGSTTVTTAISPPTNASSTDTSMSAINTAASNAINSGSLATVLGNIGLGSVLGATTIYNEPTPGSSYIPTQSGTGSGQGSGPGQGSGSGSGSGSGATNRDSTVLGLSKGVAAAVFLSIVVFVVGLVIVGIYMARRRGKVVEQVFNQEEEIIVQEKEVEKGNDIQLFNESGYIPHDTEVNIKTNKIHPQTLKVSEVEEIIDY